MEINVEVYNSSDLGQIFLKSPELHGSQAVIVNFVQMREKEENVM